MPRTNATNASQGATSCLSGSVYASASTHFRALGQARQTSCAGKALHLHRPPASPGAAPAPRLPSRTLQQAFSSLHALQLLPPEARMPGRRSLSARDRPTKHVRALQALAQGGMQAEGCQRLVHAKHSARAERVIASGWQKHCLAGLSSTGSQKSDSSCSGWASCSGTCNLQLLPKSPARALAST